MSEIPENVVTETDLGEWYLCQKELAKVKAREIMLRLRMWKGFFAAPEEGANNVTLSDGSRLCGTRKIDRKVDEAALKIMMAPTAVAPPEGSNSGEPIYSGPSMLAQAGIDISKLVVWKPELSIKAYRDLTDEQVHLVDQFLIIKDGSPSLEIKPPSARGQKKAG